MKGSVQILLLVVLLIGASTGLYLIQQKTHLFTKAFSGKGILKVLSDQPTPKDTSTQTLTYQFATPMPAANTSSFLLSAFQKLLQRKTTPSPLPVATSIPAPISVNNPSSYFFSTPIPFIPTFPLSSNQNSPVSTPNPTSSPAPSPSWPLSAPTPTPLPTPTFTPLPAGDSNTPLISGISTMTASPGERVTIYGSNFLNATTTDVTTLRVWLVHNDGGINTLASVSPNIGNTVWEQSAISFTIDALPQSGQLRVLAGNKYANLPGVFTIVGP